MRDEAMRDWLQRNLGWIRGMIGLAAWFALLYFMFRDVL